MDLSLTDLPDQIETERLIVRAHRADDGPALFAAITDSLDALRQWPASFGWAMDEQSEKATEFFCRWCASAFAAREDFPMLLIARDSGELVGSVGLRRPDWSVPKLEIGWWGRTTHAGQGFVTEGVTAVMAFGFDHLKARRLYATVDKENLPSARVCERVGLTYEGEMRNYRADPDGTLRNAHLYASVR